MFAAPRLVDSYKCFVGISCHFLQRRRWNGVRIQRSSSETVKWDWTWETAV